MMSLMSRRREFSQMKNGKPEVEVNTKTQGWGAGAGLSRVFLAPWSRSRLKKNQELEIVLLLLFFR